MTSGRDPCPDCDGTKAIGAKRCMKCHDLAKSHRVLAYFVHLVDSGQTRLGALGLEVGRRMRGETPVRPCPKGCEFCKEGTA